MCLGYSWPNLSMVRIMSSAVSSLPRFTLPSLFFISGFPNINTANSSGVISIVIFSASFASSSSFNCWASFSAFSSIALYSASSSLLANFRFLVFFFFTLGVSCSTCACNSFFHTCTWLSTSSGETIFSGNLSIISCLPASIFLIAFLTNLVSLTELIAKAPECHTPFPIAIKVTIATSPVIPTKFPSKKLFQCLMNQPSSGAAANQLIISSSIP